MSEPNDPNQSTVKRAVEFALGSVSRGRRAVQGMARLYNTIAQHAPVKLPRIPDGTRYVWPKEAYQQPPPPARPVTASTRPAPPPPEPPNPVVSPTAVKVGGLVLERVGPSDEEYRASLRGTTPPTPAEGS